MSTRRARKNRKNRLLNKTNNKSLAIVKPVDKGGKTVETKYPRKVENIRCQFCSELLIRVFGYA